MMSFREQEVSMGKGALTVALVTIVGSLLGILKNSLLAANFGASRDLDIYFAAFRVPDFLYSLLVFSSLSSSFMPIFSRAIKNGKEDVWSFVSRLFVFFLIFFGLAAMAVFVFAGPLAAMIAPGFSSFDLETMALLLRILMLQPIFLSLSNLFSSTLQGFKKFFVSSLAPVFYNLGIIIGTVFLVDFWGPVGVAWGVVLGALLHLLIQLPGLRSLGFGFVFTPGSVAYLKESLLLMVPRSLTILMNNIVLFWITSVSSLLVAGSLSIYNLADSLQSLPVTVLVMSLVTASFPFLSQKWADFQSEPLPEKKQEFVDVFDKTLARVLLVIIPIAFIFAAFAGEIVGLFLGHGNFGLSDRASTSLAFLIFALFLPFQALTMFLIRAFFATADTRTPLLIRLASSVIFQIPLIWLASRQFGVSGLVFGLSFGYLIDSLCLFFLFKKRIGFSSLLIAKKYFALGFRWASWGTLPVMILVLADFFFLKLGFLNLLFWKICLLVFSLGLGLFWRRLRLSELKSVFQDVVKD